jgi:hypothetical protein
MRFRIPALDEGEDRLLYLGDDADGVALEVMVVELETGELFVIHSMPMRQRYRAQYREAQRWPD